MRFRSAVFMAGIGFTFGLLFGLFIHLPVATYPASPLDGGQADSVRIKRDVGLQGDGGQGLLESAFPNPGAVPIKSGQADLGTDYHPNSVNDIPRDNHVPQMGHKSMHLNAINQFPTANSDSLVYVNRIENKLVYDNNRTDPKHRNTKDGGQEGSDSKLSNSKDDSYTNGIYWSKSLENKCPSGFSRKDHELWRTRTTSERFVKMDEGCGRMQNRLLTFHDDGKACARYRLNVDQIQGEIFTYYLSQLLHIENVPPSTVKLVDTNTDQWRLIHPEVANAQWSEEKPVILAKYIEGLSPAYIPTEFRNQTGTFYPNQEELGGKSGSELCELLQWSDLIVLDYLTANLDRVVNNLFNLQWNDQMMSKPTHNLEQSSNGRLVFLDNESGLFHGYRLLDKYAHYHQRLLDSLCVFRQSTIDAVRSYLSTDSIGEELQRTFEQNEPLHRYVPRLPQKNIKVLKQRMNAVYTQVQKCELQHGR